MPDQIVNFSGGKDSTAMLHLMIERNEPIAAVVFFDGGWEFTEVYDHLDLVEQKTGLKINRIKPDRAFTEWMFHRPIRTKRDNAIAKRGEVHRIGKGWPRYNSRWCTGIKGRHIESFSKWYASPVNCIGFASDEPSRSQRDASYALPTRYPLIEYGISEADALAYCKSLGYHWNGLYDVFDRVSCWCCPLGGEKYFRKLRKHRPQLWQQMIDWQLQMPDHSAYIYNRKSVLDWELKFLEED